LFPPRQNRSSLRFAALACLLALGLSACGPKPQPRIAFIPQTDGTTLWEAAHVGAEAGANSLGIFVRWSAPTREDDVEAQIALVDEVARSNYQGLVLAPNQALSLITPVRRALARGIPTVVIGSPLPIPAGGNLSYILNDDEEGGRMAAGRVAALLHGHGKVALLGINPDMTGIVIRARSFELTVAREFPGIRILERKSGSFNVPHEEQVAEDTLRTNPDLDAIVALMPATVDGVLSALDAAPPRRSVQVVGFDYTAWPAADPNRTIFSFVQQDTRAMGQQAIELIHARLLGQAVPAIVHIHPKLITRENFDSPEVRRMFDNDWKLGQWRWNSAQ